MGSNNINTKRNPYLSEISYNELPKEAPGRQGRSSETVRRRRAMLRKRRARRRRMVVLTVYGCALLLLVLVVWGIAALVSVIRGHAVESSVELAQDKTAITADERLVQGIPLSQFETHPVWEEDFLTPNEYSRPGEPLTEVNSIFVHYTANRNTSAAQNHSYFEQLKDTGERSASAHFIIGYNGEIIQCIPLDEIAYAVKTRNMDSISIECCYKSGDASFTQETYDSLIILLKWLTEVYDLSTEDILRHYDCGGKKCPLYYVEHPDAWERLKRDVEGQ
ncbi:MAG: N-acetylmuramoyl-L-alanine amidase [Lachnospiraceae bacterium]|nr:N-acetylmuramoyl-L-alanine amidase [Lachnospiraceae bacterium]